MQARIRPTAVVHPSRFHPYARRTAAWIANLSVDLDETTEEEEEDMFPPAPWRSTPWDEAVNYIPESESDKGEGEKENLPPIIVPESLSGLDTLGMAEAVRNTSFEARYIDLMLRWQASTSEQERLWINIGMLQLKQERELYEAEQAKQAMSWQAFLTIHTPPGSPPNSPPYLPPQTYYFEQPDSPPPSPPFV